jgi:ABC-type phosphate transport system substrate-binding protein
MNQFFKASVILSALVVTLPAAAEVVVVVNAKAAESSLSKDQVSQFFLGKSTSMTPVDQAENAPARAEFYKKVTDKDPSQIKALWSKLVFTGKATMPKDVGDNAGVKKAIAADPKAIGYIDKSAVDASVKVVYSGS